MLFAKKLAIDIWQAKNNAAVPLSLAMLFTGELGAGKTQLIKRIVAAWRGADNMNVTSPTFSLINIYEENGNKIMHGDFYRLKHPDEAEQLNLLDYYHDHHALIEWPEKIVGWWPRDYLQVTIENKNKTIATPEQEARLISLLPQGAFYENFLCDWKTTMTNL